MKVFQSSSFARRFCRKNAAIAIGNYDGVHVGHRKILSLLSGEAKKRKIPSVLYTFNPHPVKILSPKSAPHLINTVEQKIELISETKINAIVLEPFTKDFASLKPKEFFDQILVKKLNAQFIIVGYDFTFGSKREGNIEMLEGFCRENNIGLKVIKPYFFVQTLVSSSVVRKNIEEGNIKEANHLLARKFFIDGIVVKGDGRGKLIGFPTANLETTNELFPKKGVYVTTAKIGLKKYRGVTNIGVRPTFDKAGFSIETHLFKLKRRLYGKKVRLYFIDRLRDEIKFDSSQQLIDQINKDISRAKISNG